MNRIIICIIVLFSFLGEGFAQNWQEQLQEQQERIERKKRDQQTRIDLAFSNQMRRVWLRTALQEGDPLPEIPEPEVPKVYDPNLEDRHEEVLLLPEQNLGIIKSPVERREEETSYEEIEESEEILMDIQGLSSSFESDFFGTPLNVNYDPAMKFTIEGRITEYKISQAWEKMNASDFDLLLYQLTREARQRQLNDWGFCQLINQSAKNMFPGDKNAQNIFAWFILSQAGYISTVSYENDRVYLLVPSKQTLYGKTFLRGKTNKLYAIDLDGRNVQVKSAKVFSHKYPEAQKVLDFQVRKAPKLDFRPKRRTVSFAYEGKQYRIPIVMNKNVVDFYQTYPFVDLNIYLGAPLSEQVRRSMVDSLRNIVRYLEPTRNRRSKEEEKINFLLHFVQKAFPYKSDREQFGHEKYLFADETIYYPYSDCEDRSVLFAWLVKEIVGLDVVGVLYPGHAATAVKFSRNVPGDYILYRGEKYIICDPTYINANYGMLLPDVQGQMARVIDYP